MVKILFTASKGWIGRIIRWVTSSYVSHVAIDVNGIIYEADWTGFRRVLRQGWKSDDDVVESFTLTFPFTHDHAAILERWVGRKYDWGNLFWQIVVHVGRRLGAKIRFPFRSASSIICSEAVIRWLTKVGFPEAGDRRPEEATPDSVLMWLWDHPLAERDDL